MRETTPSDRAQLRSIGELMHPGSCALCGSGNCDDGYVDLGIYYDYEGQMYLCRYCTEQVAAVMGCLSADESAFLQATNVDLAAQLTALKAQLEEVNERLGLYDSLLSGIASNSSDSEPTVIDSLDINLNEIDEADNSDGEQLELPITSGESESAEPVKGRRPRKPAQPQRSNDSEFAL